MYCSKCGNRLNEGDQFCRVCGAKVEWPDAPDPFGNREKAPEEEQPFHIEGMHWDLEGYPDENAGKTEAVDFNWSSVVERRDSQDREPDSTMTEDELFVKVRGDESRKSEDFDWESGSTLRVEKKTPKAQENETGTRLFSREEIEAIKRDKGRSDFSFAEAAASAGQNEEGADDETAESSESEDTDEAGDEAGMPAALSAGIAAARMQPKRAIDKFYTFNKKNEEFQALLDQEYERLCQRIKEENEAEEALAAKKERIDAIDRQMAGGPGAVPEPGPTAPEPDLPEEIVSDAGPETPEEPRETSLDVGPDLPAAPEVASSDAAEAEASEETGSIAGPDLPAAASETDAADVTGAEAPAGAVEEDDEKVADGAAQADMYQPQMPQAVDMHEAPEEDLPQRAEVVTKPAEDVAGLPDGTPEPAEDAAGLPDGAPEPAEDAAELPGRTVEGEEPAAGPAAGTEGAAVKIAAATLGTAGPEAGASGSEAGAAGPEASAAEPEAEAEPGGRADKPLHYGDIFNDDDDDDDRGAGREKKRGRARLIILDIIIVILAICVVIGGILVFAEGTPVADKLQNGINKVISLFKGGETQPEEQGGSGQQAVSDTGAAIDRQAGSYTDIGSISEDTALRFEKGRDYGMEGLDGSRRNKDSVWYAAEDGQAVSYCDAVVDTVLAYYSGLTKRMNEGSDEVLSLIDPDSALYGVISAITQDTGNTHGISTVQIGEIRNNEQDYFVLVRIGETKNDGAPAVATRAIRMRCADNKALIEEIVEVE